MKPILHIAAVVILVVTLLPILRQEAWWIRIFDFPRVQILAAGALTLSCYVFWLNESALDLGIVTALGASLGYHLYRILPFTPVWRKQVEDGSDDHPASISILVANVLMENRESGRLLDLIREYDPDLILTLEINEWWTNQLRFFDESHRHHIFCPQDDTYGIALQSRFPIEEAQVRRLVQEDVPSIAANLQLPSGERFRFLGLHPRPPHPSYASETTPRDAELLIVGREVSHLTMPAIVAGDLNDVAWSHTTRLFQRISRQLDPRRGRGMFNSFHADKWYARWPLDHIFHSAHFKLIKLERLPSFGSDHFPVFAKLALSETLSSLDAPDMAGAADEHEADRKIRAATVRE